MENKLSIHALAIFKKHFLFQAVLDFVGSFEEASEFFKITLPDQSSIDSHGSSGTLTDVGLTCNSLLQVTWFSDSEVSSLFV